MFHGHRSSTDTRVQLFHDPRHLVIETRFRPIVDSLPRHIPSYARFLVVHLVRFVFIAPVQELVDSRESSFA